MTFVVTDACIKCKYTDCVEVCPVDCFYEGENMLAINPDECIDCGVCEPECPVEAIKPESDELLKWVDRTANTPPNGRISPSKNPARPMPTSIKGMEGKFEQFFSPNPGEGNK